MTGTAQFTRTITGPQVLHMPDFSTHELSPEVPIYDWYGEVRKMRRDPTIALVRSLMVAPAVLGPWTYETTDETPDGAAELIEKSFDPIKNQLTRNALLMAIDFGWAPYETLYRREDDGLAYLQAMKPLIHDFTYILADPNTGAFEGFRQKPLDRPEVTVRLNRAFLHSIDVEGTNWYGQALMENVYYPHKWWHNANAANERFDRKMSGAQWVITYPMGFSTWNGTRTDNAVIANELLKRLQASGGVAVPRKVQDDIDELTSGEDENALAWDIDLKFATGSQQAGYVDRLKYLDALKVRGLGWPERSVLEGQFGTKAEAETHSDFAIATMELRHDDLLTSLNNDPVNQLLTTNWGPDAKDTVKISRGPIGDQGREFLQRVYSQFLEKPIDEWTVEHDRIDREKLREMLNVPTDEEEIFDGILRSTGNRESVRQIERREVGDGRQSGGLEDRSGAGDMGDF